MTNLDSLELHGLSEGARIVVAMSGGVDSSVAAALLKRAGYEVIGITLQLYDDGAAKGKVGSCCAGADIADARAVADVIGIPHYVLDYERRFREQVIDDFAESYLAGETPIPCVACNQKIKFKDLFDTAGELGAEALITGHYIRSRLGAKDWELHRAIDPDKDQSYFLFSTTRQQLAKLRFPLGGLAKFRTRELASEFGLPVAEKADSQDICFVPDGRYAKFIKRLRPDAVEPGDIVHVDGRNLGHHGGIFNFTIGQRRGLGLAEGETLYVVKLDAERRKVVVGAREDLKTRTITLRELNWLGDGKITDLSAGGIDLEVKIRSTQQPQAARLSMKSGVPVVELGSGEFGISPGQACVFYSGSRILGGGWIVAADLA